MIRTITFFISLPFLPEAIGLMTLAILVYLVSRVQMVQSHLYRNEIPKVLAITGLGLLIPGGFSLLMAILYICFRVFQEATYGLCPPCWNRLGKMTTWLYSRTFGRSR